MLHAFIITLDLFYLALLSIRYFYHRKDFYERDTFWEKVFKNKDDDKLNFITVVFGCFNIIYLFLNCMEKIYNTFFI
jgi:hypothetical protein